jgi:hypothetical protein
MVATSVRLDMGGEEATEPVWAFLSAIKVSGR